MASAMKDEAARSLDAHARSIDALHQKLAAVPGVDKDRLQKAVDTLPPTLMRGAILPRKRPRGRPRKTEVAA